MGSASWVILSGSPVFRMSPPRTVTGDFVEKLLKRNFRAILRGKTCKAILALPIAKAAPDPHNDPRELGKPLHCAPLLAIQEHNKNKIAGFQDRSAKLSRWASSMRVEDGTGRTAPSSCTILVARFRSRESLSALRQLRGDAWRLVERSNCQGFVLSRAGHSNP
jgi:hypothetical protein